MRVHNCPCFLVGRTRQRPCSRRTVRIARQATVMQTIPIHAHGRTEIIGHFKGRIVGDIKRGAMIRTVLEHIVEQDVRVSAEESRGRSHATCIRLRPVNQGRWRLEALDLIKFQSPVVRRLYVQPIMPIGRGVGEREEPHAGVDPIAVVLACVDNRPCLVIVRAFKRPRMREAVFARDRRVMQLVGVQADRLAKVVGNRARIGVGPKTMIRRIADVVVKEDGCRSGKKCARRRLRRIVRRHVFPRIVSARDAVCPKTEAPQVDRAGLRQQNGTLSAPIRILREHDGLRDRLRRSEPRRRAHDRQARDLQRPPETTKERPFSLKGGDSRLQALICLVVLSLSCHDFNPFAEVVECAAIVRSSRFVRV